MRYWRKVAAAVLSASAMSLPLQAQKPEPAAPKPAAATQQSSLVPLKTDLTVKNSVTAQAVLLPYAVASRVFGKEVAKKYAVVELNINNKSSDAALIVQGVYIDYSKWALSGGSFSPACSQAVGTSAGSDKKNPSEDQTSPPGSVLGEQGAADSKSPQNPSANGRPAPSQTDLSQFAQCTDPRQVASEEYRVVRGQALNAQTWTLRNGIVRGLILTGTVLTGFTYAAAAASSYPKGVAAFTGQIIPGVETFWPDQSIDQVNRISDLGFQTNKVIAKQAADIIVCFFPIDRFLTPGFKTLFIKYPALFFAPYEMLVDKKIQNEVFKVLPADLFGGKFDKETAIAKMRAELPCHLASEKSEPCANSDHDAELALATLDGVSLNKITINIDGVMSVNTGAMPAKIEKISFDNEATDAKLWTVTGSATTLTGTITGSYLTGGTPTIQEAGDLGISKISVISDGSNDQTLRFSMALGKTVKDQSVMTFSVQKKSDGQTPVSSTPFVYKVHYAVSSGPTINGVTFPSTIDWTKPGVVKGTIEGSGLTGGSPEIEEKSEDKITSVQGDTAGSSDEKLNVSVTLGEKLDPGTVLTFTVATKQKDSSGAEKPVAATCAHCTFTVPKPAK